MKAASPTTLKAAMGTATPMARKSMSQENNVHQRTREEVRSECNLREKQCPNAIRSIRTSFESFGKACIREVLFAPVEKSQRVFR
jgi:hypothetical protein